MKKRNYRNAAILTIIIILFFPGLGISQDVELSTPYKTLETHLSNLQKDNYNPKKAAKALRIEERTEKEARDLAIKLKKIMDVRTLYVIMANVPREPDYVDTASGKHIYVLFESAPAIYLKKYGDEWLYSMSTVEAIPEMYDRYVPFEIDFLTSILPDFFFNDFLGMQIWKYFALILLIIASALLYFVFNWIFGYFLIRIARRLPFKNIADKFIAPIAHPLSFLIIVIFLSIVVPMLGLPVNLGLVFSYLFKVLIPLTVTIIAYRLADLFGDFLSTLASKTKTTIDDNLIPLARKTIKVFVVAFGAVFILENVNIPVTPLLAGISIGGLAFALAAQDTVKNFFGSVTIFTDQPFEVGDWIVFDNNEGMVEEVGIRSTRIRTFYNSLVSIPNGRLADMTVDNMGRRQYRRYMTKISVTYDTDPDSINLFVEGLRRIVENHPQTWKDYSQIHLNDFADSSIQILFYIFFEVPDWTAELEARHEVLYEITKLAKALDVRFAYPTSTLHVENFPGRESLTPPPPSNADKLRGKLDSYIESIQKKYTPDSDNRIENS